jgi:hypothetical protein
MYTELVPTLTNPTLQLAVPRSASSTRNNPEIDLDSLPDSLPVMYTYTEKERPLPVRYTQCLCGVPHTISSACRLGCTRTPLPVRRVYTVYA